MNKTVSVIIPVYNCQKYIRKCIESCLNQTYKNIEIIVVDDGSNDDTGTIIKDLASKYQSVKIIEQENAGVSNARNNGISASTGAYLLFLDADDFLEENSIEKLVMTRDGEDLVIGSYRQIKLFGIKNDMIEENRIIDMTDNTNDIYSIVSNIATAPWGKLYLSSIVSEYGIRFPIDIKFGEDEIFNIQYISHCKKIRFISDVIYNYNLQNNGAATRKFQNNIDKYFRRIIESFEMAYRANGNTDKFFEKQKIMYSDFFEKILRHYILSNNAPIEKLYSIYLSFKPYLLNQKYLSQEIVDSNSLIKTWKKQNTWFYTKECIKQQIFWIANIFH